MPYPYLSLCYHYLKQPKPKDPYPRILGNQVDDFKSHIELLKKDYYLTSLEEVNNFLFSDFEYKDKPGLLFTFDDGLKDHYLAAQILNKYNAKGLFFVPTCILRDNLPANPTIIHYSLAIHGIHKFLKIYQKALKEYNINSDELNIEYDKNKNDPWDKIKEIKTVFKTKMACQDIRRVLLYIYHNLLLANDKDILHKMHLTKDQINQMTEWGHSIGAHSQTHLSFGASGFGDNEFNQEILNPILDLKTMFQIPIPTLSYPFGITGIDLDFDSIKENHKIAFTIEHHPNNKDTNPLMQGRYTPTSRDSASQVQRTLLEIKNQTNG